MCFFYNHINYKKYLRLNYSFSSQLHRINFTFIFIQIFDKEKQKPSAHQHTSKTYTMNVNYCMLNEFTHKIKYKIIIMIIRFTITTIIIS